MNALYNEIDSFAADWLDQLIAAGHIGAGCVERRSIADLKPADVAGPGQRHFFAGIGGWSYALRLAGVPDDVDVWTGSCPCQPFSAAGKRSGTSDPRHLWPAWFALIEHCRPPIIFGEQVASGDGLAWLDAVYADLERCGYAVGAADLCAAGVGAPHIRQRLYFVAYADSQQGRLQLRRRKSRSPNAQAIGRGQAGELADAASRASGLGIHGQSQGAQDLGRPSARSRGQRDVAEGTSRRVGDASFDELARATGCPKVDRPQAEGSPGINGDYRAQHAGATRGLWADAEWIPCSDGVSRPVEPGTFPLAHGVPGRVGRLRGYGNAIVPQVAATFIRSALEAVNA